MFRAISLLRAPLRSLPQTLVSLSQSSNPNHLLLRVPAISIIYSPFSNSSRQKNEDEHDDYNRDPESPPKLFVVQPRLRSDTLLKAKLSEALNLANSLEEQRDEDIGGEFGKRELPRHLLVQNPAVRSTKAHAGTVETVKCHLNAVESEARKSRAWGMPVLDRVGLIIEIFNAHAQTKEAKLQSELAALMYKRTRLVRIRASDGRLTFGAAGEAEVVSARGRGSGGRGFISGAGETELQLQRRRILERRSHLLSLIEEVRRTRAVQRAARKRRGGSPGQGLATVAVVGYTNAGKSTLVSALSDSDLYSDDRLFATVDPRLRSVILPSGRKVLLSDTVGFISDLPVQLVEAFHATLEEVVEADLLVHVLDSSALNLEEQRSTVLQVLKQIGVSEEKLQNMIEVWNKIDLRETGAEADEYLDEGEDDETCNFSEAGEGDEASALSPGEPIDDDEMVMEMSSGDNEESMDDQEGDSSEDWKTMDGQQIESLEEQKIEDSQSQPQDFHHVEASAIMGVGLQELLNLIDKKLNTPKALESSSFDRKWRPPRTEDAGIAVEK
ncbi:hypothetical protein HHK36_009717 [Tetracentron sinense]|uniref:Hflx-type G domain-containing protein n=1 Tax=Tetracentron sinense TaxID=13715 RepID=A0A834ZGN0_TETSI|nr:hypothetical protein HHK36_009717 [Tetracentron sinense]